jgi:hypothetical protein
MKRCGWLSAADDDEHKLEVSKVQIRNSKLMFATRVPRSSFVLALLVLGSMSDIVAAIFIPLKGNANSFFCFHTTVSYNDQ